AFQGVDERSKVSVFTPLLSTPRTPEAQPQRGLAGNDASERYYRAQDAMTTNETVPMETVPMTDPPFLRKHLQSTPRTPEAQPQRGLAGNDASERYYKTQDAMTTNETVPMETVPMTDPPFLRKRL